MVDWIVAHSARPWAWIAGTSSSASRQVAIRAVRKRRRDRRLIIRTSASAPDRAAPPGLPDTNPQPGYPQLRRQLPHLPTTTASTTPPRLGAGDDADRFRCQS